MYWLMMNLYRLYKISCVASLRDLCKTFHFAQFLRQIQIVIIKILNVFLPALGNAKHLTLGRLKSLPSFNLNKIEHYSKVNLIIQVYIFYLEKSLFFQGYPGSC